MSGKAVKSSGTLPERRVRAAAIRLGLRYRCNAKDLPGSPDIVFDEHRKVVLVHGCFWHLHATCPKGLRIPHPKTAEKRIFWWGKLARNALRDERVERELLELGWEVLTLWECETESFDAMRCSLERYILGSQKSF